MTSLSPLSVSTRSSMRIILVGLLCSLGVLLPWLIASTRAQSTPRPDLGDAPDSKNSASIPMSIYPGGSPATPVAQFPTVFQTANPTGPKHGNDQLQYHLGPAISAELQADSGGDADGINNIRPGNTPPDSDHDRADDGLKFPLNFQQCQPTTVSYDVTVLSGSHQAFVNVWIDWNSNGVWGNIFQCDTGSAVDEWAVQNQPITLPGPGTYTLTTPTFFAGNLTSVPKWLRITLSDSAAPNTIDSRQGAGIVGGYRLGETEDYPLTLPSDVTPTATDCPPGTICDTPTATATDCPAGTICGTDTPTATKEVPPTETATPTATKQEEPTATNTRIIEPTFTPTNTKEPTATATRIQEPTATNTATPTATCVTPPLNMVAWYPFDETAGPTAQEIINNNDGTYNGPPLPVPVPGMVLNGLSFGGTASSFVDVADHPTLNFGTGNLSIDLWVNAKPVSGLNIILDKRANTSPAPTGYELGLFNNQLLFQLADGAGFSNYIAGPPIADGQWHFVAVTVDRANPAGLLMYVDGALVGTFNPTARSGSLTNNANLWIGRHHPNALFNQDLWFNGSQDELELFNRVLKPEEIGAIYKAGSAGKCKCVEGKDVLQAGVADDFSPANGVETAQPSPAYQQFLAANGITQLATFDSTTPDRYFAHTFSNLLPFGQLSRICEAILEIRLKPLPGYANNDALHLNFSPTAGGNWGRYLGNGNPSAGLLGGTWAPPRPAQTVVLNLAALPLAPGGTQNMLGMLNTMGYLNIAVQDDTAIDYVRLTVRYCCGQPDLVIKKTASPNFFYGAFGSYFLNVSNVGTQPMPGPIVVTDNLPWGVGVLSAGGPGWTCSVSGLTVTCTHPGPVPAGGSLPQITIQVKKKWWIFHKELRNCANVSAPMPPLGEVTLLNNATCIISRPKFPLGGISGTVLNTAGQPVSGLIVQAYEPEGTGWSPIQSATTGPDGQYLIPGLDAGVYHLQVVDPTGVLPSVYYGNAADINSSPDIVVGEEAPTPNINITVPPPATPPIVTVATGGGSSSVTPNPTNGQVAIVVTQVSSVTIGTAISCPDGSAPTNVTLSVGGTPYPMTEVPAGSGQYQATIPVEALIRNVTYPLTVSWQCGGTTQTLTLGTLMLHDPSGFITDAVTGKPIRGATVTLYKAAGYTPRPADATGIEVGTCETNQSKDPGKVWSQPAPVEVGVIANPDSGEISPRISTQITGANGYYAWDVAEGCWYVTVSAPGYVSKVSPVVGVPEPVTDLHIALDPLGGRYTVYLPFVAR